MERISGMVWDADGRTKDDMRDRRSVGGVCDDMCCRSTCIVHAYICHIYSTSNKYALYDTVHTDLN